MKHPIVKIFHRYRGLQSKIASNLGKKPFSISRSVKGQSIDVNIATQITSELNKILETEYKVSDLFNTK